jgi:hypothetical protein
LLSLVTNGGKHAAANVMSAIWVAIGSIPDLTT